MAEEKRARKAAEGLYALLVAARNIVRECLEGETTGQAQEAPKE